MGIPPSLAKNMFVQEYFVFVKNNKTTQGENPYNTDNHTSSK